MFSRILSSAIAASALVAAAPVFAADPMDGPGWEPEIVGGTTAVSLSSQDAGMACLDGRHDRRAESARDAQEVARQKDARDERDDSFEHSKDFPG